MTMSITNYKSFLLAAFTILLAMPHTRAQTPFYWPTNYKSATSYQYTNGKYEVVEKLLPVYTLPDYKLNKLQKQVLDTNTKTWVTNYDENVYQSKAGNDSSIGYHDIWGARQQFVVRFFKDKNGRTDSTFYHTFYGNASDSNGVRMTLYEYDAKNNIIKDSTHSFYPFLSYWFFSERKMYNYASGKVKEVLVQSQEGPLKSGTGPDGWFNSGKEVLTYETSTGNLVQIDYRDSGSYGVSIRRTVFEYGVLTTGVEALKNSCRAISVFPNPANEFITINHADRNTQVTIFDLTGKPVLQRASLQSSQTIDISKLSPGVYMVKCRQGNKVQQTKLLKL
jgi:hypothetical protein